MKKVFRLTAVLFAVIASPALAEPLRLASYFQFDHYRRLESKQFCTLKLEKDKKGEYKILPTTECAGLSPKLVKTRDGRWQVNVRSQFPKGQTDLRLTIQYTLRRADGTVEKAGMDVFPNPIVDTEDRLINILTDSLEVRIPCDPIAHFFVRGSLGSDRNDVSLKVVLDSEQIQKTSLIWEIWNEFIKNYSELERRQIQSNGAIYVEQVQQDPVFDTCTGLTRH